MQQQVPQQPHVQVAVQHPGTGRRQGRIKLQPPRLATTPPNHYFWTHGGKFFHKEHKRNM